MENGDELPPASTTLRLAKASEVVAVPPAPAFFLRRDKNERDVSLGWLQYFCSLVLLPEDRFKECLKCMTADYKPKNSHRVLVVDVDQARNTLAATAELGSNVRFVYTPVPNNPCHASIEGLSDLEEALWQLAAQRLALAVIEIHEWSKVKP